jgi:four helix bundle protein
MFAFKELTVYKKSFALAMEIFLLTKKFPSDEKYALISQIRNSSRSVSACIAEEYRKRQYQAHFVSKISDADMENSETSVWIDFAFSWDYINEKIKNDLIEKTFEIGKMLNHMILNPEKFKRKESDQKITNN